MSGKDGRDRVARTVTWIAGVVASIVLVGLPLLYFANGYADAARHLSIHADNIGNEISTFISSNPVSWAFETTRLGFVLERANPHVDTAALTVRDRDGRTVAQYTPPLAPPHASHTVAVRDFGAEVGSLEITLSMRPLLRDTTLVSFGAILLSLLIFFPLRLLPLRALQRATEELLREKEYVADIIDRMQESLIVVSLDGTILSANPATRNPLGYTEAELLGHNIAAIIADDGGGRAPTSDGDDGPVMPRAGLADLAKTGFVANTETTYVTKDCATVAMLFNGAALHDDKGQPRGAVCVATDITDRRAAERLLRQAKRESEQASQAKSAFLASMSHEFRTPLNTIIGFADLLLRDDRTPLSPANRDQVESIRDGDQHLLGLVNEVLDLAKIEADRISLVMTDVDANRSIRKCVNLMQPLADARRIAIVDRFGAAPPARIRVDSTRFQQILLNLLANAIKYNVDGGTVTIDGSETAEGFLRIAVADTGAGIAEPDQARVFQVFHRLGDNPAVAREGTGIGLAVCKLLTEKMAGRIGLESKVGSDSLFWVEFPRTDAPPAAAAAPAASLSADDAEDDGLITTAD